MKNDNPFYHLTDEELVETIVKDNNSIIFELLYDRYAHKVYNKCYGFAKDEDEAKDLTQDVFLKLFTKLHSFKNQSKFSAWLYSFTYNMCVNYVNRDRERKISKQSESIVEENHHIAVEVSDDNLFQMKVDKLKKALELIDAEDKSILLLKYQDDISIKELGVLLSIGESAVKMRLKRAKSRVIDSYHRL